MSRWIRWQFVVPRLLLCVVVALGAQFAAGLAARSIAISSATEVFGAQVDVAHARVSLTDGHVLLSDMNVTDPNSSGECWLTAEGCELEIAAAPLLHKQTIIERARIRGLHMGTSSTERDAKSTSFSSSSSNPSAAEKWFSDDAVETASERLAHIDKRFDQDFVNQLESVKRTTAFCTRFPQQIAALESRAAELQRNADELEKSLDAANVNRLRHDETLDNVPAKVAALRKELDVVSEGFKDLPQRLDEERRSIVAARRQDEQFLQTQLRFEAIDQELLNAYLLREQVAQPLDEMTTWLRCMRQMVSQESTRRPGQGRGEDVLFAGIRPTPSFLIRALEVHGEVRLMGRPVELRGLISNFTTTPALHGEPIQMRFSASGSMPLEVRAKIDRTAGRLRDELFADCREVPLPEQSLGQVDQLRLKLAPSIGSLSVSMKVEDDKLSGDIQLVQDQVRITPVLAGDLGEMPIAVPLHGTLGEVRSLATRISLHGTIDKPACRLWSNLGPAVAEALDRALKQHAEEHTRAVLAEARRTVDERLAGLERQVADRQENFASKTASMPDRIDTIARLQTRRERISVEQLGRRLPNTSLFR